MNEIKVTVTYDKPNTNKFDALMAEYEAAKKYADETVAYYKPLADVAEDAKFDAILEQLETIKEYARRISEITGESTYIREWVASCRFDISYHPNEPRLRYEVKYGGKPFTKAQAQNDRNIFFDGLNIIGRWEELKAYECLEKAAFELLSKEINNQKRRANREKNRLYNITKGGN